MAQALSEEEFHRMQAQLLELRTQNYQLSDELRKNTAELNSVRQKTSNLEKDYVKAQKVVEVDALLNENKMLQGKLHSQEDDFRLQNSTLMQELSKLCSQIEQLELENRRLREGQGLERPASGPVDAELLRLQAENSALQKKLKALQEHADVNDGKAALIDGLAGTNGVQSDASGHSDDPSAPGNDQIDQVTDNGTKIDEIQQRKEEELKSINLRVQKLQTDLMAANQNVAELKEQLQSKQKEHEMAIHALKDQVACQSAVSQEQVEGMLSENDALRTNLAALEQIQTVKTQEQNLLREQNLMLNAELQQKRTELESFLAQRDDLNSQLQESNRANSRLLEQLTELGLEKDKLQQELEEARKTADKRKVMLDELAIETAQEKSRHKEELSDVRLQHEKEVLSIRARYEKELRDERVRNLCETNDLLNFYLQLCFFFFQARTKELEGLQPYVEELKAQVQSMEGTKGCFERRLKEAEVPSVQNLSVLNKLTHIPAVSQAKAAEVETVKQQVMEMQKEREELNNTISKLKQEIKDTVDGQRILEKKGSSALKDLKRQLHLERKRADKLQERLQEILTNTKTRTGLEELVLSEISSPSHTQQTGDSSSISSFSYREIMKDGASAPSTNKSNTSSPQSQRPADLSDDEVSELFQRLAEVQQEKWMLEEKVKHLEVSCSSMADDICKKSAIIETYVMDSRRDVSGGGAVAHGVQGERGGLSSVLRDLVKPGDENLREMNKKLQNMLEEQLTKNMHLQKVKRGKASQFKKA
uniref:GRIP1-associated protein 1-like n=1 Tax=Sinocyclocheilus rhinocerous TaxID=307959 RepID=A0A673MCN1_9TELE